MARSYRLAIAVLVGTALLAACGDNSGAPFLDTLAATQPVTTQSANTTAAPEPPRPASPTLPSTTARQVTSSTARSSTTVVDSPPDDQAGQAKESEPTLPTTTTAAPTTTSRPDPKETPPEPEIPDPTDAVVTTPMPMFVEVPDLGGLHWTDAEATLAALSLAFAVIGEDEVGWRWDGRVLDQDPWVGELVDLWSEVGVVVGVNFVIADYGDDQLLDEYWDACAEGDMAACDDLFVAAATGTRYQEFGATCGDRLITDQWCVVVG